MQGLQWLAAITGVSVAIVVAVLLWDNIAQRRINEVRPMASYMLGTLGYGLARLVVSDRWYLFKLTNQEPMLNGLSSILTLSYLRRISKGDPAAAQEARRGLLRGVPSGLRQVEA